MKILFRRAYSIIVRRLLYNKMKNIYDIHDTIEKIHFGIMNEDGNYFLYYNHYSKYFKRFTSQMNLLKNQKP